MSIIILIIVIVVAINLFLYMGAKKELSNANNISNLKNNLYEDDEYEDDEDEYEDDEDNTSDKKELFITCPKCNNKGWKHGTSSMGSKDFAHSLASSITGGHGTLDKKGESNIGFRARGNYGSGEEIWVCNVCDSAIHFHWYNTDDIKLIDDEEYSILKRDFEKGTGLEY
jgi:hypothetical protein